ncbi:MAG: hypothetical protein QNI96_05135 [Woeseiaceae bacterium]|nr:hypothetical protein [Woeseiaceae bacterium]
MTTKLYEDTIAISDHYNEKADCAVRAVSIATSTAYEEVHKLFVKHGRRKRQRTPRAITKRVVRALGYKIVEERVVSRTVRTVERELMADRRYLIFVRGHVLPFAYGEIHDHVKGRAHRVRAVYWLKEK